MQLSFHFIILVLFCTSANISTASVLLKSPNLQRKNLLLIFKKENFIRTEYFLHTTKKMYYFVTDLILSQTHIFHFHFDVVLLFFSPFLLWYEAKD